MTQPDGPSAVAPAMASGEATESATPISARVTSSAAAPRRVRTQLLDTEVQLSIVEGRIARRQDTVTEVLRRRNVVGWLLAGVILGLTEYLLYFFHVLTGDTLVIVPTISLVLFIVAPLATVGEQQTFISRFQLERQELLEKKQIIESFLAAGLDVPTTPSTDSAPSPKESYFDRIVAINLDNLSKYLTAYYNLVQLHTEKSFNASRIAGGMGFALILVGIIVGYVKTDAPQPITYIATSSGIITGFIAGVFFYLYNRTVRQLKDYHDSLINVQNVFLAMTLVADTSDPDLG